MVDQLSAEREVNAMLRADVDKLIASQQSLQTVVKTLSEERHAVLDEKAKLDKTPRVSDR